MSRATRRCGDRVAESPTWFGRRPRSIQAVPVDMWVQVEARHRSRSGTAQRFENAGAGVCRGTPDAGASPHTFLSPRAAVPGRAWWPAHFPSGGPHTDVETVSGVGLSSSEVLFDGVV